MFRNFYSGKWRPPITNPLYPLFSVCHAELNAVLNKNSFDCKDCSIYVALFPCNECAKVIIQAGIKCVVYCSDKNDGTPENIAAKKMFEMAKVDCRWGTNLVYSWFAVSSRNAWLISVLENISKLQWPQNETLHSEYVTFA